MNPKGKFYITRQLEFAAAHRLYREDLTEAQNLEVFGQCANPFGHGHNYILECTFQGLRQSETGMVVHFERLKRILRELVIVPLDHRNLNHDVPFMKGVLPTSENLIAKLWEILFEATQSEPYQLYKLRLASTARNWVEYYGPEGAPLSPLTLSSEGTPSP